MIGRRDRPCWRLSSSPSFPRRLASFLLRPIWHLHALLFSVPFAALGLSRLLTYSTSYRRPKALQNTGVATVIVVFTAFSAYAVTSYEKETNYRWAVDYIEQHTESR